jgi:hypothetical protein
MTTVVLDSKDLLTSLQTGQVPVPPEVAADNARQAEKANGKQAVNKSGTEPAPVGAAAAVAKAVEVAGDGAKVAENAAEDDVEGEDGLTPRQKRELTEKMQKAIGKKHRELKEAEEFAAAQYNNNRMANRKIEQLERELRALKEQAPTQVENTEPKRENFESDEKYRDAMVEWRVEKKFKEKEAEVKQSIEQQRQQQIVEEAKARMAKALELVPDYQQVLDDGDAPLPDYLCGYMQESEMIAELAYHFAKHPEVLERLGKLTPARALVEVGKIESKLQPFAKSEAKEPKSDGPEPSTETGTLPSKTRATAPVITPLNTASTGQVEKDPREMNIRETIHSWQKKNGAHLTLRKRH